MLLQDYIQVMRPAVEEGLRDLIGRAVPARYAELHAMLAYHMGWEGEGAGSEAQGKRIRPLLVLLSAEAAGGSWPSALPAAVAVELLHNFSLVHDDIQDNSPLRRGRPTVWKKWGIAQAINTGDVLFTLAFLSLQDLNGALPSQQVLLASRTLQQTCLRLTEGQFLDMSYESETNLSLDAYWPMIAGKTSALLACCAELGALVAGAQEQQRSYFREFGNSLGLAFQVLDDWLGIWGDVALTGKSTDSDLVTGKKTFPVISALEKNGSFARRWSKGSILPAEVAALARMLEEEGAHQITLDTADRLTGQALRALCQAVGEDKCAENPAYLALQELTRSLLSRKK